MPFERQPEPAFWGERDRRWRACLQGPERPADPLGWTHERRTLREWFHELSRRAGEPRLCAYCDGSFEQSRETIDHFLPVHHFPELALAWSNLFPACDRCNEKYKGTRWSCRLVRPDQAPVHGLFDIDEETGHLLPGPRLDRWTRGNVRLTIRVLGLNAADRCRGRLRVIREVGNAWKHPADRATLAARATEGPYRFVAQRALAALQAMLPATITTPPSSGDQSPP